MTVFDNFKSKGIDELVDWLDEYGAFDSAPWMFWYNENFCKNCPEEEFCDTDRQLTVICSHCEISGKCKFFPSMDEPPSTKQIIKMWLESEDG